MSNPHTPGYLRIGLDVHHVLSRDSDDRDAPKFLVLDPGAYAFLVLLYLRYGLGCLYICSRINGSSLEWIDRAGNHCKHWVLQFLEEIGLFEMGFPRDNLEMCNTWYAKGDFAFRHNLSCYVDDHFECLAGIYEASPSTDLIMYNNVERHRGEFHVHYKSRNRSDFAAVSRHVHVADNWRQLADWCNLPTNPNIWQLLNEGGPPNRPHDMRLVEHCAGALTRHTIPRAPPHAPSPAAVRAELEREATTASSFAGSKTSCSRGGAWH